MRNKRTPFFSLINLSVYGICGLLAACAVPQNPQGGPRDTTPPKVVTMIPKNLTKYFKAKKITIEFDEYFKLNDEFKEFSISPDQEKPPILKTKGKKLEIDLQDTLEKNTTYTLNFGKAVADVNEGNVIKNLSYVFSTGAKIDSLQLSGTVVSSLTGEPELDATVFILPLNKDSLLGKKRPSIYTTTDSSGRYQLNNLREDYYKVYAIKEPGGGGDKIYQQISDEIGFRKDTAHIDKNIQNYDIQIFKEKATKYRTVERKFNLDGSMFFVFNQQLKEPKISVIQTTELDKDKYVSFSKNNDTARVWLGKLDFDSVKLEISAAGKKLDTISFTRGKKDDYKRELTFTDNTNDLKLSPFSSYTLTANFPIASADPSKITLLDDSVKRTNFELVKDSVDFLKYHLKYPWRTKKTYTIKLEPGAFTAIFNTKNKAINKVFTLGSKDDYGTLTLHVEVPDTTKSYLVEFISERMETIKSYPISKNQTINFANYPSGKYYIRVVYDANNNGNWDTGNVSAGLQPEKIWYDPVERSLRANWEREDKLIIPPPPDKPTAAPFKKPGTENNNNINKNINNKNINNNDNINRKFN
ncbi:Ig-like domain-containing protein [Pedobacter sp. UYP30]|uniref:Ig-like domain-containing protein n=1 Tax=Pedobacter sp. UYP30 TaxID=1756400 RepID=UPI0033967098